VINRAQEILAQLEMENGSSARAPDRTTKQLRLFPERNPLLDELRRLDLDALSPLEALNHLFEWKQRFSSADDEIQDRDDSPTN
jgi:DNA mismatch repair protein MutS